MKSFYNDDDGNLNQDAKDIEWKFKNILSEIFAQYEKKGYSVVKIKELLDMFVNSTANSFNFLIETEKLKIEDMKKAEEREKKEWIRLNKKFNGVKSI